MVFGEKIIWNPEYKVKARNLFVRRSENNDSPKFIVELINNLRSIVAEIKEIDKEIDELSHERSKLINRLVEIKRTIQKWELGLEEHRQVTLFEYLVK